VFAHLPRARPALGIGLVIVMLLAWIAVAREDPSPSVSGSPPSLTRVGVAPTTSAAPVPKPVVRPVPVPRWVPAAIAATCRARSSTASNVVVECTPGRGVVRLRYQHFASVAALRAAYAEGRQLTGGTGASACATGAPDERAWSPAASPAVSAGRYRCRVLDGEAEIIWSSERAVVLGTADRSDGDLRSLYEWWTTVPGPKGSS
jgi:hypothetical protein